MPRGLRAYRLIISNATQHVAHMGYDSEKGFTSENIDPTWERLLSQLTDMGISRVRPALKADATAYRLIGRDYAASDRERQGLYQDLCGTSWRYRGSDSGDRFPARTQRVALLETTRDRPNFQTEEATSTASTRFTQGPNSARRRSGTSHQPRDS